MKIYLSYVLAVLIILSGLTVPAKAATGADMLVGAAALDTVIDEGLKKTGNMLSDQQRELFFRASALLSRVKLEAQQAMKDVNRTLNREEMEIFNEITSLTITLQQLADGTLADLSQLSVNLENAVTRLPFADDTPAPVSYDIPILTTVQNGNYSIIIQGVELFNDKNYIVLNGKRINTKSTLTKSELRFDFGLTKDDIFADTIHSLEIHLFESKYVFWEDEHIYKVAYNVAPEKIADVKIIYRTFDKENVYDNDREIVVRSSPGGCKTKEVKRTINPTENYYMDVNKVEVTKIHSADGSSSCHFDKNDSNSSSLQVRAKGSCSCNSLGIINGCSNTECKVTFKEYKIVDNYADASVTHELKYDTSKVIELPANTHAFVKVVITFYNGKTIEIMEPQFDKHFLSFKYNASGHKAQIAFSGAI